MKKNKFLLILCSCLLFACQEDDVLLYEGKPGLYFSDHNVNDNDNTAILQFNRQDLTLHYDFTMASAVEMDDWGYPTKTYLGDSLVSDTILIDVYRSGKLIDHVNSFSLRKIQMKDENDNDENALEPFEIEFFNPYNFEEGEAKTEIKVVFHRPDKSGEYKTIIGFDLDDKDGFVNTINEFSKFNVIANNRYHRPQGWVDDTSIYGPFSEEKYAFYITVLGKLYQDWHEAMGWDYLPKLKAALKEYNDSHDVPKKFSF